MAIQFTDFSGIKPQESPMTNLFENAFKGYQMGRAPAQMDEEQKQRQLANQLKEIEVEQKPKQFELERRYKEALINKANELAKGGGGLGGIKGNLANAMKIRNSLDPKSPNYERDLQDVNNYITKLGTSGKGIQVTTNPEGGVEVSVGGRDNQVTAGLPPLPKGQTYLFDQDKKPIGIGKPYSEAEKKEESGRAAFNHWQKFITDAQAPYSGKGSTKQFESDVANYNTDEAAKNRIDNLLAADKLLFSATVKEEATLGGANTNQAYNRITHSLETSEIYPLLKKIAKYQLPQGYAKASSDIFREKLNEGTELGKKLPAYKAFYYNPEQQSGTKAPAQNEALATSLKVNNPSKFQSAPKTEAEFNKWYVALSPADKKAYREYLRSKK